MIETLLAALGPAASLFGGGGGGGKVQTDVQQTSVQQAGVSSNTVINVSSPGARVEPDLPTEISPTAPAITQTSAQSQRDEWRAPTLPTGFLPSFTSGDKPIVDMAPGTGGGLEMGSPLIIIAIVAVAAFALLPMLKKRG